MKQKKTKSFSAHLPFIVYKNFPHTNELLEYDQHLKNTSLLENSFGNWQLTQNGLLRDFDGRFFWNMKNGWINIFLLLYHLILAYHLR